MREGERERGGGEARGEGRDLCRDDGLRFEGGGDFFFFLLSRVPGTLFRRGEKDEPRSQAHGRNLKVDKAKRKA
jgi:hypothetical protein